MNIGTTYGCRSHSRQRCPDSKKKFKGMNGHITRASGVSFSIFWILQSHLLRIPSISGLRPTPFAVLPPRNHWRPHGLQRVSFSRSSPVNLRGGDNDEPAMPQLDTNHTASADNFTTNAAEQADAARLKSEMDAETLPDAQGTLDHLPAVEISPSGVFKYVLIEATDKQARGSTSFLPSLIWTRSRPMKILGPNMIRKTRAHHRVLGFQGSK